MRDVLLADASSYELKDLTSAIDWLEKARDAVEQGKASLEEIDQSCPFNRGDSAWFFYVLLFNKEYKTLRGPYLPMIQQGWSAKSQCIFDGLVCANCFAAGGPRMVTKLKRCGSCRLVSYCGRSCQRSHHEKHRRACREERERLARQMLARPKFERLYLPPTALVDGVKLVARHISDGYGCSSIILYKDLDDGVNSNVRAPREQEPWAVVTAPVHDEHYRNHVLGPDEACLDVDYHEREVKGLIESKIVVLIPGKYCPYTPNYNVNCREPEDEEERRVRSPLPVARIMIEQVDLADL